MQGRSMLAGLGLSILMCSLVACDDDDADEKTAKDAGASDAGDRSDRVFDPDSLLKVELTLAEDDWALIRHEGRGVREVLTGCADPAFEYTKVQASATIDGKKLGKVEVRKKGYLGSLSVLRPSLRVDLQEFQKDLTLYGQKSLTLNNSRQDPSFTHQCMAYALFARAGVPSPRCAFAKVSVNGEDLGTYVNVEPVRKPMLARHFADDDGLLYEGSGGADFRSDMLDGFEQKTQESTPSVAPLQAVIDALAEEGEAQIEALEDVIDMDQFLRFWAVESLISHWDGYAGDLNNFFVYQDPKTQKLSFIPWGTDGAFDKNHAFLPEVGRPFSVLAWARLPRRLYEAAMTRERYRAQMRELLDEVWDEDALLDEVDRIAKLVGDDANEDALDAQREFIRTRRAEIEKELAAKTAPAWSFPERPVGVCLPRTPSEISGTFEAKWGGIDAFVPSSTSEVTLTLAGKKETLGMLSTSAGIFVDELGARAPAVRMLAVRSDGTFLVVQLVLGPQDVLPGEYTFHGLETFGYVVQGTTPQTAAPIGLVSEGSMTLDEAGMKTGDLIKGRFEGVTLDL